jgi:hypothetical protein
LLITRWDRGKAKNFHKIDVFISTPALKGFMRGDKEALEVKAMERLLENCEYSVNNFYAT